VSTLRNWLIASANVVASDGGIALPLPPKPGNSSTAILFHPSIARRYDANTLQKTPTPGKWWGRDQHQGRQTGRTASPAAHTKARNVPQRKTPHEAGASW
jgi:hypothetical protein